MSRPLALLAVFGTAGCCLGASNGGQRSAASGGTTSGDFEPFDAGTCLIDGGRVAAGTWPTLNSCVRCDPSQNAADWTLLQTGAPCELFVPSRNLGPLDLPVVGSCEASSETAPALDCESRSPGSPCDAHIACIGGFCGDAGTCVVDQDLGQFTDCGILWNSGLNVCAQGPCCPGEGDVVGRCCGLFDGGVHACLSSGAVCYDSANCCNGLKCVGRDAVLQVRYQHNDAGYGFCVPD
jgi:hypothetical protein